MVLWISALLFAAGLSASLGARSAGRKRRERLRQRRIEEPNSHYSAPGVRRIEALERWSRIPLDALHPVNRDEVRRLLRQVVVAGPDGLSGRERQFLENLLTTDVEPAAGR
jgi:hypothetical protein